MGHTGGRLFFAAADWMPVGIGHKCHRLGGWKVDDDLPVYEKDNTLHPEVTQGSKFYEQCVNVT